MERGRAGIGPCPFPAALHMCYLAGAWAWACVAFRVHPACLSGCVCVCVSCGL